MCVPQPRIIFKPLLGRTCRAADSRSVCERLGLISRKIKFKKIKKIGFGKERVCGIPNWDFMRNSCLGFLDSWRWWQQQKVVKVLWVCSLASHP